MNGVKTEIRSNEFLDVRVACCTIGYHSNNST